MAGGRQNPFKFSLKAPEKNGVGFVTGTNRSRHFHFPGPTTGAFNGLHLESNYTAVIMKLIPKMNLQIPVLTILTAILFSNCGMPTTQTLPVVSEGKPPAGKCLIILEREVTSIGAWVNNSVYDGKKKVGSLGKGGKLVWIRDPGSMRLFCSGPSYGEEYGVGTNLTTAPGKIYNYNIYYSDMNFRIVGPGTPFKITGADGAEMSRTTGDFQNMGTGLRYNPN